MICPHWIGGMPIHNTIAFTTYALRLNLLFNPGIFEAQTIRMEVSYCVFLCVTSIAVSVFLLWCVIVFVRHCRSPIGDLKALPSDWSFFECYSRVCSAVY